MCYSNSLTSKNVDLKKKYKKKVPPELVEEPLFHASGFIYPHWRVITAAEEIQQMRWGLIPSWFKGNNPLEVASKTLNARSETAHEKPSFRDSLGKRHCIIPSNGFFEYQTNGKEKKPFFIYPKNGELFHMAGIYENAVDLSSGELIGTFSMLTCEANGLMAEIHNTKKRMPVLLEEKDLNSWLMADAGYIDLLRPLGDDFLDAHPINPTILKGPEANSQKVFERYEPLDYQQGSLF